MYFSPAFVLAALPFLATALPSPATGASGMSIPIQKRRSSGKTTREAVVLNIKNSVAKFQRGLEAYERNTGSAHPLAKVINPSKKRDTGSISLTDDAEELWYAAISVGTPAVKYTVDFDTGSSDLFLPASTCGTTCSGHTLYNPSKSSTSKSLGKSFSLAYGDGSTVSGKQYTDTVQIGGLTATKQTLGSATKYSTGFESEYFPADGLLGMAFKAISDYNANPFFQTLLSQDTVSAGAFAFKFTEDESSLYLGGVDEDLYTGDFTYVPVTQEAYWQVDMDGMKVGSTTVTSSTSAIIDTGTTLIIGDSASAKKAYKAISGSKDNGDGTYTVPCSASANVTLTFGGEVFTVSSASFALDNGDGTCIGGLGYEDDIASEFWIVGDVFLQNVYTVFDVDNSQVGFATLA
ncbi:acid protease [Flagelloscypha sp. PMI_526]|nr:acid protease [Flagelloscypha sp. PMI_526]